MTKINHNNTEKFSPTVHVSTLEEQRKDVNTQLAFWKQFDGHPEEKVMAVLDDLLLMIKENKKMATLEEWYEKNHLYPEPVRRWRKKYPDFEHKFTAAKEIMSEKML
jgi:hypothetical protein